MGSATARRHGVPATQRERLQVLRERAAAETTVHLKAADYVAIEAVETGAILAAFSWASTFAAGAWEDQVTERLTRSIRYVLHAEPMTPPPNTPDRGPDPC